MLASPTSASTRAPDNRFSSYRVPLDGTELDVHRFQPRNCKPRRLLFVFAGYERDAWSYLRRARRLAKRTCATVYAPDFDRERFPRKLYQLAGVSGRTSDLDSCIGRMIRELIRWAHAREGMPERDYLLFGHSAGGQMLSRLAAYCPPENAGRIIIANPSAYVAPNLFDPAPYGFGSIVDLDQREHRLQHYLALPVVVYLGSEDRGTELLDSRTAANRQGSTRFDRGLAIFEAARALAGKRGWTFAWTLVVADGVGHSSRGMLRAPELLAAIGGR